MHKTHGNQAVLLDKVTLRDPENHARGFLFAHAAVIRGSILGWLCDEVVKVWPRQLYLVLALSLCLRSTGSGKQQN